MYENKERGDMRDSSRIREDVSTEEDEKSRDRERDLGTDLSDYDTDWQHHREERGVAQSEQQIDSSIFLAARSWHIKAITTATITSTTTVVAIGTPTRAITSTFVAEPSERLLLHQQRCQGIVTCENETSS